MIPRMIPICVVIVIYSRPSYRREKWKSRKDANRAEGNKELNFAANWIRKERRCSGEERRKRPAQDLDRRREPRMEDGFTGHPRLRETRPATGGRRSSTTAATKNASPSGLRVGLRSSSFRSAPFFGQAPVAQDTQGHPGPGEVKWVDAAGRRPELRDRPRVRRDPVRRHPRPPGPHLQGLNPRSLTARGNSSK